MIRILYIYAVRPEETPRFLRAATALVTAIAADRTGVAYEVYQARDQACFYHYAVFADAEAVNRHLNSDHHAVFEAVVQSVCIKPMDAIVLEKIASV